MGSKPLVGIFMPVYNVAHYIGDAIQSIMAQDMGNWELVVLDDASEDGTFDAATKAADGRCFVARNGDHCGLIGKMKNEAIGYLRDSEPEFICHVGGDDMITPDCLSSFVAFMKAKPDLAAACSAFDCFDDAGNRWMMPHVVADKGFDSERLMRYMCFYPHRFYRFEALEAIGGYSNTLSSAVDYDLALRLDEKFKLGRLEGKVTYHYRQHAGQVSRTARPEQDLNAKKALQAALDRRGTGQEVVNDRPPFQLREREGHFIWGKR
jgi:glycosyltransferase involved in cell wall biosynthesis